MPVVGVEWASPFIQFIVWDIPYSKGSNCPVFMLSTDHGSDCSTCSSWIQGAFHSNEIPVVLDAGKVRWDTSAICTTMDRHRTAIVGTCGILYQWNQLYQKMLQLRTLNQFHMFLGRCHSKRMPNFYQLWKYNMAFCHIFPPIGGPHWVGTPIAWSGLFAADGCDFTQQVPEDSTDWFFILEMLKMLSWRCWVQMVKRWVRWWSTASQPPFPFGFGS